MSFYLIIYFSVVEKYLFFHTQGIGKEMGGKEKRFNKERSPLRGATTQCKGLH